MNKIGMPNVKTRLRPDVDLTKGGKFKFSDDRLDMAAKKFGVTGKDKDRYVKNRGYKFNKQLKLSGLDFDENGEIIE